MYGLNLVQSSARMRQEVAKQECEWGTGMRNHVYHVMSCHVFMLRIESCTYVERAWARQRLEIAGVFVLRCGFGI